MLEKIAKHINKILVFVINILLIFVVSLWIKSMDKSNSQIEVNKATSLLPISDEVLQNQKVIASDREKKLRSLNTDPKQIQQKNITTTTTTTPTTTTNRTTKSS